MNRMTIVLLVTFGAILLGTGLLAYVMRETPMPSGAALGTNTATSTPNASPTPHAAAGTQEKHPLLWELFGPDASGLSPNTYASWESTSARIALRFSLAAFLAALLAFRPRRGFSLHWRNPYVAQTQILMAVVAGAMMMVVGDSAARAFGIFAAASLVRFRTNIRDPKEITVLLICLGVGLAAGVGRWDMAVILTVFVLIALGILEYFEQAQVFRSMEVTIKTKNVDRTTEALKKVFASYRVVAELREIDREDEEDPMGKLVYLANVNPAISTDKLSDDIFAADKDNVDGVEWKQEDSKTYIYK